MSDDVVARAKAALEGVTEGPWVVNRDGWACISSGSDSVFHGYFEGICGDCGEQVLDAASVAIAIEDAEFIATARSLVPELVAEVERLRTWDGLMELLDEFYPEDIFPTQEDRDTRDPGPRIISLIRHLNAARAVAGDTTK